MGAEEFRLTVVILGILVLLLDFFSVVYRKIAGSIGLCWCWVSVILLALGLLPAFSDWSRALPVAAFPGLALAGVATILVLFYLSCHVSQLIRKNQELAMHVSLLNQENEKILQELKEYKEHEAAIRH